MSGSSSGGRHRILFPVLFVLLLLVPPAAVGQPTPDPESQDDFYRVNLAPEKGSVNLEFLGAANVPIQVEDASGPEDDVGDQSPPRRTGRLLFEAEIVGNDTQGWSASVSKASVQTRPGQIHDLVLNIQAGATVVESVVEAQVTATYETPNGDERVTNVSVLAVLESFPRASMEMAELPEDFSPDETQRIPVTVTNRNYYPDMVTFQVSGPDGWLVSPPSSVRLNPGETKTVFVDVKPPDNPWFLYTTQSDLVSIDAVSETNGATMVTLGVPVTLTGSNVPSWVAPHFLMLLIGAATIVKRSRTKRADRKLEKGKPSFPGLDPEHEAEFEALKIEDPERAAVLEDRLQTLYGQRKEAWREAYERRKDTEETLQEAYNERHAALVAQREDDEDTQARRRRELLERKRQLLERKREALQGSDEDEPSSSPRDEGR